MKRSYLSFIYRNYSNIGDLKDIRKPRTIDYDIIISGGGMVGSSLACILSKNPLLKDKRILLIEGMKKKEWILGKTYSNRVSALNPSTKNLLDSVGIWKHIYETRVKSFNSMKVWGMGSEAVVEFKPDKKDDSDYVAYIVENDVLLAAVDKELTKLNESVTVVHGSKVKEYELPLHENELVSVVMEDGKKFTCSLLLGTDGVNSKVRETMGVEYVKWNYNQSAVVATLELEQETENDTAWQRFLTTGPVALLPLNNKLSSLVWSTSTEAAKNLVQISNDEFVQQLNNALFEPYQKNNVIDLTSHLTDFLSKKLNIERPVTLMPEPPRIKNVQDGSRATFPLGFGHASSYVRPGVALLGDAAHRVHPLAGQGVNLGFGDIECLSRVLGEAVFNGKVINSFSALKEYENERLRHNVPTMVAIDVMNRIYSTSNSALLALGHLAMQITNCITPVKKLMIKQASS